MTDRRRKRQGGERDPANEHAGGGHDAKRHRLWRNFDRLADPPVKIPQRTLIVD